MNVLSETEISLPKLSSIFQQNGCEVVVSGNPDEPLNIYVPSGLEMPIWVIIQSVDKVLRFYSFIRSESAVDPAIVNAQNESLYLAQFYCSPDQSDVLAASYYITYEGGIIEDQIFECAAKFALSFAAGASKVLELT